MGDMLSNDLLKELVDGCDISGYVLVGGYSRQMSKNKKPYMSGNLEAGVTIPFKIWNNKPAFSHFDNQDLSGQIVYIDAEVNIYEGSKSLIISSVSIVKDARDSSGNPLKPEDFLSTIYNIDSYWSALRNIIEKHCSEEGLEIFDTMFDESPDLKERFLVEFAACSHHDNVKSGLLAHTTKVTKMATILSLYPNLTARITPDLLFLGCAFHDIGKTWEYTNGVIIEEGRLLSHNTLGVLLLEVQEEKIKRLKGDTFYYNLLAIVAQHHGEYGEPPRTIASQVIHMLDLLESSFTDMSQMVADTPAGEQIIYDGRRLI